MNATKRRFGCDRRSCNPGHIRNLSKPESRAKNRIGYSPHAENI